MPRITKPISISLPPDLLRWLDEEAKRSGRTRTAIVIEALKSVRTSSDGGNWETKLRKYNEAIRRRPSRSKE